MLRYIAAAAVVGLFTVRPAPATAEGVDFGYVYTAETAEKGETELSLWATDRRGKGAGHYDAQDYRIEVERGITDRFQLSGYLDFAGHHVRALGGEFEPVDRDLAFTGIAAELKYKILDPSKHGLGLAFYIEPGWSRIAKVTGEKATEYEVELKAIVQKNFARDRLVWAANLTLEPEWEREHEEITPGLFSANTNKELAVELATGIAYRAASRWWIGLEGRYHSVYPDWTHGLHRENYAVSAGPTAHYDGGKWTLTATWLPQLFGSPNHGNSTLELDDHEKREFRLKASYEF
jgi:hypothetical protein